MIPRRPRLSRWPEPKRSWRGSCRTAGVVPRLRSRPAGVVSSVVLVLEGVVPTERTGFAEGKVSAGLRNEVLVAPAVGACRSRREAAEVGSGLAVRESGPGAPAHQRRVLGLSLAVVARARVRRDWECGGAGRRRSARGLAARGGRGARRPTRPFELTGVYLVE